MVSQLIGNIKTIVAKWFIQKTDIQTDFDTNPSNAKVPSEKLVKESLEQKAPNRLVTTEQNGMMSSNDKSKLDNIETEANKTIIDDALSASSTNPVQNKVVNTAIEGKADSVHSHSQSDITDLTSALNSKAETSVATINANGLMSKEDKIKLNGIASGADNVEFTRVVENGIKVGTISINGVGTDIFAPASEDVEVIEYGLASVSSDGLMSKEDKEKLNNISEYASNVQYNGLDDGEFIGTIIIDGEHNSIYVPNLTFAAYDHSHNNYYTKTQTDNLLGGKAGTGTATQSNNGLMSKEDKVKLDGVANGATKTVVDSSLSSSSTNPVQNKVMNTALNGKSDTGHNHDDRYYTESEINSEVSRLEGLIDGVVGFTATEVSSLPATGENGVLYLVPKTGQGSDVHDEYVWVESTSRFELVGSTSVNLDGYYTSSQVDVLLNGKSSTGHTHDDRYYTESEIDTKLSSKAGTNVATSSANGLLSSADKAKLDGISAGANKTIVDSALSSSSTNPVQNKAVNTALSGKANSSHNHNDLYYTESEVDALLEGKADNTVATTSTNGLMSSTDKTKLNGIATGANKTTIDDNLSTTSTNPVQNKVVKSALDNKAGTSVATTNANGLMSKEDKVKLDGIESQANKITVDSSLSSSSTNPVQNKVVNSALNGKSDTGHTHDDRYYTESEIDTKLSTKAGTSIATSSANGLLSSADKTKLDGIATGANKTVVDSSLSSSSTNPVQNKVVNTALSGKANSSHNHNDLYYTESEVDTLLNDKAGTGVATYESNGLMSKEDKAKLSSMDILHFKVTYENGTTVTFPLYYQGGA